VSAPEALAPWVNPARRQARRSGPLNCLFAIAFSIFGCFVWVERASDGAWVTFVLACYWFLITAMVICGCVLELCGIDPRR
jgi:hypothetical protein